MILTGIIAFVGRDPMMYYHNIWFRLKMLFLLAAAINIAWFHFKVQKSQPDWDAIPPGEEKPRNGPALIAFLVSSLLLLLTFPFMTTGDLTVTVLTRFALGIVALVSLFIYINKRTPSLPTVVKLSGAISLMSWLLVIVFGRFIAYDWFYCEKTDPGSLAYVLQECEIYNSGGVDEESEPEVTDETATEEEGVVEEDAGATEEAPAEGETPAEPAQPAQPAPGQGG
jgi:hypothetical protein